MFFSTVIKYLGERLWVIVSVFVVFGAGFAVGYLHEHDKLVAYRASVESLAAEQERQTQAIIDRHEKTKDEIHADYKDRLAKLRADYERRMREQSTSDVSTACRATSRSDDSTTDSRSLDREALIERCAETTLQLEELQKWVKER